MINKKKILIAEDEEAIRIALQQALETAGFIVLLAPDGQTAVDLANQEKPDLIILDVIMPKLHGIDVYTRIRREKWGAEVMIIFLTNFGFDPKVKAFSEHPHTDLLVKNDTQIDDLVNRIKEYLK